MISTCADWYLWIPLYGCACAVNLLNWEVSLKAMGYVAKATMGLGICLWVKVVAEDYVKNGIEGFLSLNLSERMVREKTGSGLVVSSMILQLLAAASSPKIHRTTKKMLPRYIRYGKISSISSFCISLHFFLSLKTLEKIIHSKQVVRSFWLWVTCEDVIAGMALLVAFSYGLPIFFFLVQKGKMKFWIMLEKSYSRNFKKKSVFLSSTSVALVSMYIQIYKAKLW